MHPESSKRRLMQRTLCSHGFTIVEMVVVIAVVVILGGMSMGFIQNAIASYVSTEQNVQLSDMADSALRKMNRDIHNALPNTVRVTSNGADSFVEFIPILTAGRYRAGVKADGSGDPLLFTSADTSFDVLGPPVDIAAGNKLVMYNLGIQGADAYEGGANWVTLTSTGNGLSNLTFPAKQFALASPNNRFFVVGNASSYACDMTNGRLLYYDGYGIQTSQPSSLSALNALATPRVVVDNVVGCSMDYTPGVLQRTGLVTIALHLAKNGGVVRLVGILNVVNSP